MEQAPVHSTEVLANLAAESLDLLVERAQAFRDSLDVRLEVLGHDAHVSSGLGGACVDPRENSRLELLHLEPRLGRARLDLVTELSADLLAGDLDLVTELGADLLGGCVDLLA